MVFPIMSGYIVDKIGLTKTVIIYTMISMIGLSIMVVLGFI